VWVGGCEGVCVRACGVETVDDSERERVGMRGGGGVGVGVRDCLNSTRMHTKISAHSHSPSPHVVEKTSISRKRTLYLPRKSTVSPAKRALDSTPPHDLKKPYIPTQEPSSAVKREHISRKKRTYFQSISPAKRAL